ncbi:MAG: YjbQ family protein [Phycisphaeraceae bacterium]|nr:YjbQ family protein [Phycisphaeraceae bacterium]
MQRKTLEIRTRSRDQMLDLTEQVRQVVRETDVQSGTVMVYVPHTTAGVTINENADPDVVHDMLTQLDQMVPWRQPFYQHGEGNSASHVKATMTGSSVSVLIDGGQLVLGTWQGIWFCEFDGPRTRQVHVAVFEG